MGGSKGRRPTHGLDTLDEDACACALLVRELEVDMRGVQLRET